MKSVWFSLFAVAFYAAANVLLEQKLSKYNNLTIIVCYAAVITGCAFLLRQTTKTSDPSYAFPSGSDLGLVLFLGLLFVAADYFYIGAYTTGGNLLTITSIMIMFPVLASVIKFLWVGAVPNRYHVLGYVVAAIAVILIAKGNMIQEK